jgi:2-C-methyl-D-erythritol 4-phosphate cytidylyltransferase
VPGGETRFHSVKNALQFIHEGFRENAIIAIHDAARPLISKEIIERTFDAAERYRVVCPVVPIVDSIREKTKTSSRKVNRDDYCIVQTPQVFYSKYLLNAYEQDYSELFTDDVSVIEASKILKPFLVEGSPENIKITTSTDLAIAETILKCRD